MYQGFAKNKQIATTADLPETMSAGVCKYLNMSKIEQKIKFSATFKGTVRKEQS
jgi:hypothetical protein